MIASTAPHQSLNDFANSLVITGISEILAGLKSTVGFTDNVEITLEMDPGTFDENKLTQIRSAGVNRLSLGVQSFDKEVLLKCGRAHTVEDVARALRLVTSSEFKDNFSIDLISSLPGLSIELWQETLEKAASSGCSHISVYDLQVEDKTAFGRWYSPGVFPLPTDEQSALMYCRAAEVLKVSTQYTTLLSTPLHSTPFHDTTLYSIQNTAHTQYQQTKAPCTSGAT